MNNVARMVVLGLVAGVCVASTGCAGVKASTHSYNTTYKLNQPVKDSKCYDAAVLLGANLDFTRDIAKKVLAALDARVLSDSSQLVEAQRNRHVGVLVGSGGEELSISLKSVSDRETFVAAATKTGFVGGAGQKAWSCQIVDEMVKLAAK